MATLGSISVGGSVFLNVNGVPTEFIVVHQGLPSSYDSSCNGTWVLAKDIYTLRPYDTGEDNDYVNSDINAWLGGEFFDSLDSELQSKVLRAKIPYIKNGAVMSGIEFTVFLLAVGELSSTLLDYSVGSRLSYFSADTKASRIAYYNGTATIYYLRNPGSEADPDRAQCVDAGGSTYAQRLVADTTFGIRPAMILDPSLMVDAGGSVVFANFKGFANIDGVWRELSGGYSKVNGEWRSVVSGFSKVENAWKEPGQTWAMYAVDRVYEPSAFGSEASFTNPSSSNPYLMASQAKKDGNGNVDWGSTYTATSSTTLRNNFGTYPYCSMSSTLDADGLYKITSVTTTARKRKQVTGWALTSETIGSYIGDVSAKPGTYPENGIQGDYWYVLKE